MTDNHTDLCKDLRGQNGADVKLWTYRELADLIESQAARIQQQALEYVSLFDQCSEHLARIAELQRELETARQERNAAGVNARRELMPAYESRIAELEADRDCWRDQCSQRLNAAEAQALELAAKICDDELYAERAGERIRALLKDEGGE